MNGFPMPVHAPGSGHRPETAQRLLAIGAGVAGTFLLVAGLVVSLGHLDGLSSMIGIGLSVGWAGFMWLAAQSLWTESPMAAPRTAFLEVAGGLLMVVSYSTVFSLSEIRLIDWLVPLALLVDGGRRYFGSRGV